MPEQKNETAAPIDKTRAVLVWVNTVLERAEKNPAVLMKAKAELDKHKGMVKGAIEDALLPEFKPYAELVAKLFNS